jgi:hypothetical protein
MKIKGTPRLYIDEFVGISNRLETLPLAFAIRKAYGHEIVLDWRELDSFRVDETRRGKVRILARLGAERVRNCDAERFASLRNRKIILRSLNGPSEILDPIYMEVARKIHLNANLAGSIRETFASVKDRPVIGVHIRHGDFVVVNENRYDVIGAEWPAVPIWWYEKTMAAIIKREKNACFFLSCTGDPAAYTSLHRNFDLFTLEIRSHYGYKETSTHKSTVNPVADLFALACCPVLLATPISGYSHWAANVLGGPTTSIVPIPGATPDEPAMGRLQMYGRRLPVWSAAGRKGTAQRLTREMEGVDFAGNVYVDWL